MKKKDLHILMLEDDPLDAELNKEQLAMLEEYNCIVDVVPSKKSFEQALKNSAPDIIICDYNIPNYTGLEALNHLKETYSLVPFIFVTGAMPEEIAADAIKAGAWDYVVKDRLFRLPLAIKSVLKLKREKEFAALAEARANRLLCAIEQTSAQIIVTDKEGIIEYINKKASEISGYDPDEIIGKNAKVLLPEGIFEKELALDFQKLLNGEVINGERQSYKKDGSKYWEFISITPIRNEDNHITNLVAVKEDITQRKKMEAEIIKARDKAQESDKLKNAFLQNMSHEIRTPLNAIVGFSSLLKEPETLKKSEIKDYIEVIIRSSNQLLSIVSDVLTVSSIQTGQESLNLKVIDLNQLMDNLYNSVIDEIILKNLVLKEPKMSSESQVIISDEIKLKQILSNLLNNAVKFTHEGYIEFGYELKNEKIEFFVRDTGIGIDEKYQEEIFESFRQIDSPINVEYGGTGLGLFISKSYAQMLKGSVHVKSKPREGSIFYVTIPYISELLSYADEEQGTAKLPEKPLNILIAEDEHFNFMLFEALFSQDNLTLFHAKNGLEAYNICVENPKIDIVIMDIKMPVMDGIKAFKEIKKIRKDLPVIAQTAYSLENDKMKILGLGFTDYVTKPIDHQQLIEKINRALADK